MKTKLQLSIAALLFCTLALSSIGLAHSGRTNAQGCHNDTKTGGYHCHNSGSLSSSSYTSPAPVASPTPAPTPPPTPSVPPAISVDSLLQQIKQSYEAGNIDQAMILCEQLKIMLEKERTIATTSKLITPTGPRPISPLAFETSEGIKGTITFPGSRAYIFKPYSPGMIDGNEYGRITISIPGSFAADNRMFRIGSSALSAFFKSSAPSVVDVNDMGYLDIIGPGKATVWVTIGDFEVALPFEVIQLPITLMTRQSDIIESMGFPDEVRGDLWYWKAYPGMCLRGDYLLTLYSSWDGAFQKYWK